MRVKGSHKLFDFEESIRKLFFSKIIVWSYSVALGGGESERLPPPKKKFEKLLEKTGVISLTLSFGGEIQEMVSKNLWKSKSIFYTDFFQKISQVSKLYLYFWFTCAKLQASSGIFLLNEIIQVIIILNSSRNYSRFS